MIPIPKHFKELYMAAWFNVCIALLNTALIVINYELGGQFILANIVAASASGIIAIVSFIVVYRKSKEEFWNKLTS